MRIKKDGASMNINKISDEDLHKIAQEDLKDGQEFSSKTAMLRSMGLRAARGGRNSELQDNKLRRFINWESVGSTGYKIRVTEIYQQPLPQVETRGGEREIIPHIKNIENVHINLLVQAKDNQVIVPKGILYELLHMVNHDYRVYNHNTEKLSEKTNISKKVINEFYNKTDQMLKRHNQRALNNLKRKNMIWWNLILVVS